MLVLLFDFSVSMTMLGQQGWAWELRPQVRLYSVLNRIRLPRLDLRQTSMAPSVTRPPATSRTSAKSMGPWGTQIASTSQCCTLRDVPASLGVGQIVAAVLTVFGLRWGGGASAQLLGHLTNLKQPPPRFMNEFIYLLMT